MSTSPVSPVQTVLLSAAPQPLPVPTNAVSTFLKRHETLIIFVLGFLLFWFVSGRVENIIAAHDNNNLTTVKAELAAQVATDKKTQDLVAQQAADMKALSAKMLAQDAALVQANKSLATALSQRQQTDATLPTKELAARIYTLSNAPSASISFSDTGSISLERDGAVAVVQTMEQVPVLTEQLANETKVADNTNTLLSAANGQVATLNTLVAGKDLELKKADDTCKAEIKTVKDAARKSKRRWFIGGFIAGFASRQVIKTYLGI